MQSNWLNIKYSFTLALAVLILQNGFSQGWVPVHKGLALKQDETNNMHHFQLRFKSNGPLGKDWIHGSYLDGDSLFRVVAYREGGTWVPLPFYFSHQSTAADIGMYGDTLYIIGAFSPIYDEKNSIWLNPTYVIKWHNDSVWVNHPTTIIAGRGSSMSVKGDSIVISGYSYYNPPKIIYNHFMSANGGATWQYPYSIIHPTDSTPNFGSISKIRILDNGDILTLNNGSPPGSPYRGLARWDGQQWNGYGKGISSGTKAGDFEFYKGELYMAGNFSTDLHPDDPGKLLARWDGWQWHDVGGGLEGGYVAGGFFEHDSVLYCAVHDNNSGFNTRFGDAAIPHLAGWDGHQWCGTRAGNFSYPPSAYGIIHDTLFATFYQYSVVLNGDSSVYMMYFDGDYLHGPNSICSTLGLGEEETQVEEQRISIYPNPSSGLLNISLPKETTNAQLSLYSLSGQLVFELPLTKTQNQLKLPKGISGLYLVVIESAGQVFTEKVLVESE